MKSFVVSLIALVAGIGAGFALSPATWAVLAARSQAQNVPTAAAEPTLVDVTTLIEAGESWDADDRARVAARLDTVLVSNGYEVRVEAMRPEKNILAVHGVFGRVSTMKLAREFDFGALQRAGFIIFGTQSTSAVHAYIVEHVLARGIGAPVDNEALIAYRKTLR